MFTIFFILNLIILLFPCPTPFRLPPNLSYFYFKFYFLPFLSRCLTLTPIISLPSILSKPVIYPLDISQSFFLFYLFFLTVLLFAFHLYYFLLLCHGHHSSDCFPSTWFLFYFQTSHCALPFSLLQFALFLPYCIYAVNFIFSFFHLVSIPHHYYFSYPYPLKIIFLSVSQFIFVFSFCILFLFTFHLY